MLKEGAKKAEDGIKSDLVFLMSNLLLFSLDPTVKENELSDLLNQFDLSLGNEAKSTEMVSYEEKFKYFKPLQDVLEGLVLEAFMESKKKRQSLQFDKKIKQIFQNSGGAIQVKTKEQVKAIVSDSRIDYAEFYSFVDIVLFLTGVNISSLKHQDQSAFSDPNSIFYSAFDTSYFKNLIRLVGKFPKKLQKTCKMIGLKDDKLAECSLKSFIEKSDEVGKILQNYWQRMGFL